jgi:hypothetical protein
MAMDVVPCTESASQFSATLVEVIAVAPKRVGAPTPHELVPTQEESCWKWWMASNMVAAKTPRVSQPVAPQVYKSMLTELG